MGDDEDQARIRTLEAEVERLHVQVEETTATLAETEARSDRRRERFEAELDRRDRLMDHAEGRIRRRDAALAAAQRQLAKPLIRPVVWLDRMLRRIARRILGKASPGGSDPAGPTTSATAAAVGIPSSEAGWRRSMGTRIESTDVRVWLVGPADRSADLRASLAASGWSVAGFGASDMAPTDLDTDVVIATAPDVRFPSLPETSLRVAWVVEPTDWLSDPRFEDYDLVLTPERSTAAALTRLSAHRPEVLPLGADLTASAMRAALRSWSERPSIAIHIPPRDWAVAGRWGDTQFARGLQRGFTALGWTATVHLASETDAPRAASADVAIHLQGISTPPIREGQPTALWIISHPDRVRAARCRPYRLVFVASDDFAEELARRVGDPVRSLHQATDPERFFPEAGGPSHDVLFVGNSRGVRRPVLDAVAATRPVES